MVELQANERVEVTGTIAYLLFKAGAVVGAMFEPASGAKDRFTVPVPPEYRSEIARAYDYRYRVTVAFTPVPKYSNVIRLDNKQELTMTEISIYVEIPTTRRRRCSNTLSY